MNFHILTLFPDMVLDGLGTSITGRAVKNGIMPLINIRVWMITLMGAGRGC